jgi:hypothetical protein
MPTMIDTCALLRSSRLLVRRARRFGQQTVQM